MDPPLLQAYAFGLLREGPAGMGSGFGEALGYLQENACAQAYCMWPAGPSPRSPKTLHCTREPCSPHSCSLGSLPCVFGSTSSRRRCSRAVPLRVGTIGKHGKLPIPIRNPWGTLGIGSQFHFLNARHRSIVLQSSTIDHRTHRSELKLVAQTERAHTGRKSFLHSASCVYGRLP